MRTWTERHRTIAVVVGTVLAVLFRGTSSACVGVECMQILSTADGGGELTVQWDFGGRKVQTFQSFCAAGSCLYSTIDPGFIGPVEDLAGDEYHRIVDGTSVRVEVVSADPGLAINVNGNKLSDAGDSATVGRMPDIHSHPSWQLVLPAEQFGDFRVSYRLTTDSHLYAESRVFNVTVTNIQPTPAVATPTPEPLPTQSPAPCPGDCSANGTVTVAELVRGMRIALGNADPQSCPEGDVDGDGTVSVDEMMAAVGAALEGCSPRSRATLDEIQALIFTPTCATRSCHDAQSATSNLVLEDGASYNDLVGVLPDVLAARNAGMLRVDPTRPENSFLLTKLEGPPPGQGSRMPLVGEALAADQIDLIRSWIVDGALPAARGFARSGRRRD